MKSLTAILLIVAFLSSCQSSKTPTPTNTSLPDIKLIKVSDNAFMHVSYLLTKSFGKVGCNGLLYVNGGEAIIFDTPTDEVASKQLNDWIEQELKAQVIGVVVNHFHIDCLGSLDYFHKRGIPSYSNISTQQLAKADSVTVPNNAFEGSIQIPIGKSTIECRFLGEGHTEDNIVSWLPDEKILFGGCMIKSLNAGKGNLEDANIDEWSNTVEKVKRQYADVKTVIPGHGKFGGIELLDYTIEMFRH